MTVGIPGGWWVPTLAAGVVEQPSVIAGSLVQVRIDVPDDVVRLSGVVEVDLNVTIAGGAALFTVAPRFRPSTSRHGAVRTAGNTSTHARWTMASNGEFSLSVAMTSSAGAKCACGVDGITYTL